MARDHDLASGTHAFAAGSVGDANAPGNLPAAGADRVVGCPRSGAAHRRAVLPRRCARAFGSRKPPTRRRSPRSSSAGATCRLLPSDHGRHLLVPHGRARTGAPRRRRHRRRSSWRRLSAVESSGAIEHRPVARADPRVVPDDGGGPAAVRRRRRRRPATARRGRLADSSAATRCPSIRSCRRCRGSCRCGARCRSAAIVSRPSSTLPSAKRKGNARGAGQSCCG